MFSLKSYLSNKTQNKYILTVYLKLFCYLKSNKLQSWFQTFYFLGLANPASCFDGATVASLKCGSAQNGAGSGGTTNMDSPGPSVVGEGERGYGSSTVLTVVLSSMLSFYLMVVQR